MADRESLFASRRAPGWYLVDYDTLVCLRGPYESDETAGAVRREIEGDRNVWIVDADTLTAWEAEKDES